MSMTLRPGWPRIVRALALWVLLAAFSEEAGAVSPLIRDLIIVDRTTDVTFNDTRGGVVRYRYRPPIQINIASLATGFVDPTAAVVLPDRTLLVSDLSADPVGYGQTNGAIFRVDPSASLSTGVAELLVSSALFVDPTDLLLEPDGRVLMVDSGADPNGYGGFPGAVFRVDPVTGNLDVVAAPPFFVQPRSLSFDRDGSVLICDLDADPLGRGSADGAIFRLNPVTGAVTLFRAFAGTGLASPSALVALPDGSYLVADRDATPGDPQALRGAVYRFTGTGGPLEPYLDDVAFIEPADMILGVNNDVFVMDQFANPNGLPGARGTIFRFDLTTRTRIQSVSNALFKNLTGLAYVRGAEIDSTVVRWTDESRGSLRPGDLVTVRARVRSTGTDPAVGIVLSDTLGTSWDFVAGSDSVSAGNASFDWNGGVFRWSGDLAVGEEAIVRFRLQLRRDVEPGEQVEQGLRIRLGGYTRTYRFAEEVFDGFQPGAVAFVDERSAVNVGLVATLVPGSREPEIIYFGAPLVRPVDAQFLDDGTLAILDTRAIPIPGAGSEAVFLFDGGSGEMRTLWTRAVGDGLVAPSGIGVDLDGSLLLVDRDANPRGFDYTPVPFPPPGDLGPGAVYRLTDDGELDVWFSDSLMTEPVDVDVDGNGIAVVVDFKGTTGKGDLWEYDRATGRVRLRPLNVGGVDWFRDPLGLAIDDLGRAIIADAEHFNDATAGTDRGSVLRVVRGGITSYAILSQSLLLVDPSDCYFHDDGMAYITDRDADPLNTGSVDTGAVFRLNVQSGFLETVAAGASLQRPDGPTGWVRLSLDASELELSGLTEQGGIVAGDSVMVSLEVSNTARRRASQVVIDMDLSEILEPFEASSSAGGETGFDAAGSRVAWTGSMARQSSMRLEVKARVRTGFGFGRAVPIRATVRAEGTVLERTTTTLLFSPFQNGDVLVVDEAADPARVGNQPGAIFAVQGGGFARLAYEGSPFLDPQALLWRDDAHLLVGDRQGTAVARIFELDTYTGLVDTLDTGDSLLVSPVDLLWSPEGDLLIVDASGGPTERGAIYRMRKGEPPMTLWASDARFGAPSQAVYDGRGRLFLADRAANPNEASGNPGAVFEIDGTSGEVLRWFQFPEMPEPTGIDVLDPTRLVVTDLVADPRGLGGATGTLFTLEPDADSLSVLLSASTLRRPYRSVRRPNGNLLILDLLATNPTGRAGNVFRFDPVARTLQSYAWSDSFRILRDLIGLPSAQLAFERFTVTDPSGPPLYAADRLDVSVLLRNRGSAPGMQTSYRDPIDVRTILLPESVSATRPGVSVSGQELRWEGEIAPFDSVEIRYQLQLDPVRAAGDLISFRPVASSPETGDLSRRVDLPVFVSLETNHLYVADSDADPYGTGALPSSVMKVNLSTGAVRPYFGSTSLRELMDVEILGDDRPIMYLLDQQARVVDGPGRGGIFRVDPANLSVSAVAGDTTWFSAREFLPLGENRLLVLDAWADPFRLTTGIGPGAIYEVDLTDGSVETRFSDARMGTPVSFARLPSGELAVLDQIANPLGHPVASGALWRLDLETGDLEVIASEEAWERPAALALRPDGSMLVLDERATPEGATGTGSLWQVSSEGEVSIVASSPYFRAPHRMTVLPNGDPFIADRSADPFAQGHTGAMLQWAPFLPGRFVPLSASARWRTPQGFFIYRDLTPVLALPLFGAGEDEGIRLRWDGLSDRESARYLVYRRPASGPEDPGDSSLEGYTLLPSVEEFIGRGPHELLDRDVEPGQWYVYLLAIVRPDGGTDVSLPAVLQAPATLLQFGLRMLGAMPASKETTLRLVVPRNDAVVRVAVHDVSGRRVRSLVDGRLPAGIHAVPWNLRDDSGHPLPSGVYFARAVQSGEARVQRIVIVR